MGFSSAPVPYLFVCAMEEDDGIDSPPTYPFGSSAGGIDDVLGCGRASSSGTFNFPVLENQGTELYLVTWFCDNSDRSFQNADGTVTFHDDAEVCVRMNAPMSVVHRKFTNSRESVLKIGQTNYLNWNLSCPNKAGSTSSASAIACTSAENEPSTTGSTNSSYGWNKEFVHVYRSAAETVKTFSSLKPTQDRVADTGCGANGTSKCTPCSDPNCQDEMNLVVYDAVPPGVAMSARSCIPTPSLTGNWQSGYDLVCIRGANVGAFNPFRTVHEVGHGVMRRFMKTIVSNSRGCTAVRWATGGNETSGTSEGFANFFAVAAWWNADMAGFEYDGLDVMNPQDGSLTGSCGAGTTCNCSTGDLEGDGRPTQFFVDLWQSAGSIELRTQDILRIWSTFDLQTEAYECGPEGRNLRDFRTRYSQIRSSYGWPATSEVDDVMTLNCTNRHTSGQSSCDCALCSSGEIGVNGSGNIVTCP